jgi:hypothetical protein
VNKSFRNSGKFIVCMVIRVGVLLQKTIFLMYDRGWVLATLTSKFHKSSVESEVSFFLRYFHFQLSYFFINFSFFFSLFLLFFCTKNTNCFLQLLIQKRKKKHIFSTKLLYLYTHTTNKKIIIILLRQKDGLS